MPEIDSVTGILTMPWWIAAVAAACALFFCIFMVMRNGVGRSLAGLAWFGVIALALALGWNIHERLAAGDRAAERRALDGRLATLTVEGGYAALPPTPYNGDPTTRLVGQAPGTTEAYAVRCGSSSGTWSTWSAPTEVTTPEA